MNAPCHLRSRLPSRGTAPLSSPSAGREAPRALRVLYDHALERLLQPEGRVEGELEVGAIHILGALAVPGAVLPFFLGIKYLRLSFLGDMSLIVPALRADQCLYLSLSVSITGLATLFFWDGLFPDRKDFLNLAPLPIRARDVFLARLGAVAAVILAFALAANLPPAVVFPMFSPVGAPLRGLAQVWVPVAAHLAAGLAAALSTFLSLSALQGLLLLLPRRLFLRLSALLQSALAVALLLLLVRGSSLSGAYGGHVTLSSHPVLWYLRLWEGLIHGPGGGGLALSALGLSLAAFLLLYAASYRRFVGGSLESPPESLSAHPSALPTAARLVAGSSRRAVLCFTLLSVFRSRPHRLLLCLFAGLGLAPALPALASGNELAAVLLLQFALLLGLRAAYALPVDLPAGWVFRVVETDDVAGCRSGARLAAALVGALAPALLHVPLAVLLHRDVSPAASAAVLVAGLVLLEALLVGFRSIPFASALDPGGANLKVTLLPGFLAFLAWGFGLGAAIPWVLSSPRRSALTLGASLLAIGALRAWDARSRPRPERLRLETSAEGPITLGLSVP